jgi:hypothetical protein
MTALHGPLATFKGYGCLVRMRYGLAYKYVAERTPLGRFRRNFAATMMAFAGVGACSLGEREPGA